MYSPDVRSTHAPRWWAGVSGRETVRGESSCRKLARFQPLALAAASRCSRCRPCLLLPHNLTRLLQEPPLTPVTRSFSTSRGAVNPDQEPDRVTSPFTGKETKAGERGKKVGGLLVAGGFCPPTFSNSDHNICTCTYICTLHYSHFAHTHDRLVMMLIVISVCPRHPTP